MAVIRAERIRWTYDDSDDENAIFILHMEDVKEEFKKAVWMHIGTVREGVDGVAWKGLMFQVG